MRRRSRAMNPSPVVVVAPPPPSSLLPQRDRRQDSRIASLLKPMPTAGNQTRGAPTVATSAAASLRYVTKTDIGTVGVRKELLGRGSFASVYEYVVPTPSPSSAFLPGHYAVKDVALFREIPHPRAAQTPSPAAIHAPANVPPQHAAAGSVVLDACVAREAGIARLVGTPALGAACVKFVPDTNMLRIIMPLASVSLDRYMGKCDHPQKMQWSHEMYAATAYLHENGIAHGDIKLDNFMLDLAHQSIVLGDFGIASTATLPCRRQRCDIYAEHYRPPEFFCRERTSLSDLMAADVWACSASAYALFTGAHPSWGTEAARIRYDAEKRGGCGCSSEDEARSSIAGLCEMIMALGGPTAETWPEATRPQMLRTRLEAALISASSKGRAMYAEGANDAPAWSNLRSAGASSGFVELLKRGMRFAPKARAAPSVLAEDGIFAMYAVGGSRLPCSGDGDCNCKRSTPRLVQDEIRSYADSSATRSSARVGIRAPNTLVRPPLNALAVITAAAYADFVRGAEAEFAERWTVSVACRAIKDADMERVWALDGVLRLCAQRLSGDICVRSALVPTAALGKEYATSAWLVRDSLYHTIPPMLTTSPGSPMSTKAVATLLEAIDFDVTRPTPAECARALAGDAFRGVTTLGNDIAVTEVCTAAARISIRMQHDAFLLSRYTPLQLGTLAFMMAVVECATSKHLPDRGAVTAAIGSAMLRLEDSRCWASDLTSDDWQNITMRLARDASEPSAVRADAEP